jgi:site-specific DNA-methyltransferase (adenine-specific)
MKYRGCIQGDSLQIMPTLPESFADLIIADPPFNIGFKYDCYDDSRPDSEYLTWTHKWIKEAKRLLKPDGNLLICIGDKHVSDIDYMCRHACSGLELVRLNWMIWHYAFGQSGRLETRTRFTNSKTHILRYAKTRKAYFNAAGVAVPSARQLRYNDKRADKRGKCPDDVFIFKRIAGTHNERVPGIKTQMPVALLRVWVKAMCRPSGMVYDPFPGSGASMIAAKQEGREYFCSELSPAYADQIGRRLAAIE